MTDRLTEIIAEAIAKHQQLQRIYPFGCACGAPWNPEHRDYEIAQRIRQALREEPVEVFGLRPEGTTSNGVRDEDGVWHPMTSRPLYALPQEEGEKE